MIELFFLLLALAFGQEESVVGSRGLPPVAEPEVSAAIIEKVYLPIISGPTLIEGADSTLYGYASPHRREYNVTYYNWRALTEDCMNENFWPMARGQPIASDMIEVCDNGNRTLLLYNEPELDHYPATPEEAVFFVRDWADKWSGPVLCCGNLYSSSGGRDGLEWFLSFLEAYGDRPPIDGIHVHVYAWLAVDKDRLVAWKALADANEWQIHVTESGMFTSQSYPPEEIAKAIPKFLDETGEILRPVTWMWFSDYLKEGALGGSIDWHNFNLTDASEAVTVVGKAWETHTNSSIQNDRRNINVPSSLCNSDPHLRGVPGVCSE